METVKQSPQICSCLVCGSESLKKFTNIQDFEFGVVCSAAMNICLNCRMISMDPLPTMDEVATFYPNYHVYQAKRPWMVTQFLRVFNWIQVRDVLKRIAKREGRILEIGCARGSFLGALSKFGRYELWGVDIDSASIEVARRIGVRAFCGTIESIDLPEGYFDLIIVNNVLEHFINPEDVLRRCNRLLSKGGKIYGETPTSDGFDFKLWGRYWFGYHYPRHIHVFNRKSLRMLAEKTNFLLENSYGVIHPGTWAISMQNWLNNATPFKTKIKQGRSFYTNGLMLLFLPLNLLEVFLQKTGVIRFVMHKVELSGQSSATK